MNFKKIEKINENESIYSDYLGYTIVYLQGEEANEVLDIIENKGEDAGVEYLKQWDNGSEMEHDLIDLPFSLGSGFNKYYTDDNVYYMAYSNSLSSVSLYRYAKLSDINESKTIFTTFNDFVANFKK